MGILSKLFGGSTNPEPLLLIKVIIPPYGPADVHWIPETASQDDLGLAALTYGIKIGWLMEVEVAVKELFQSIAGDLSTLSGESLRQSDLLNILPTAKVIASQLENEAKSVQGGETFEIAFYRKHWSEPGGSPRQMGWVTNTLPQPGLAPNLPWSSLLLQNAVWPHLSLKHREGTVEGWTTILSLLQNDGSIKPADDRHLEVMYMLISDLWQNVAV